MHMTTIDIRTQAQREYDIVNSSVWEAKGRSSSFTRALALLDACLDRNEKLNENPQKKD